MTGLAHDERMALCDLFDRVGPDAPTLCAGWRAADLAAHLVVRERNPAALPGAMAGGGPLAAYTERVTEQQRDEASFAELVGRLRTGPPLLGLFGLPGPREWLNLHEFFVHHEDVRRPAGLEPRDLGPALEEGLWRRLRGLAMVVVRAPKGIAIELVRPDGAAVNASRGAARVRVEGEVGELFLYAYGRRSAARVEVSGDPSALARLAG
ncbi:MAG: TIGR03085 family metal-binding protein [Actinomycetota bacterium]|nr:TIGR03085 family metal-binding protein [Actinomycetota bacterium]